MEKKLILPLIKDNDLYIWELISTDEYYNRLNSINEKYSEPNKRSHIYSFLNTLYYQYNEKTTEIFTFHKILRFMELFEQKDYRFTSSESNLSYNEVLSLINWVLSSLEFKDIRSYSKVDATYISLRSNRLNERIIIDNEHMEYILNYLINNNLIPFAIKKEDGIYLLEYTDEEKQMAESNQELVKVLKR